MADRASFNRRHLEDIWGRYPMCILCNRSRAQEFHHVLKRGYNSGIKLNSEDRTMMSSVLQAAPLCHTDHSSGDIHHHETCRRLLITILGKVNEAIANGIYEWQEKDEQFYQRFANRYLALGCGETPLTVRRNIMQKKLLYRNKSSTKLYEK